MAYVKKIWKDYPDTTTPILASDLNNIENGLETVDTLSTTTANNVNSGWYQTGLSPTFTYVSWDSSVYTGVVNSNLDLTPYLSVGMKVKFTQNSAIKYAFITAITSTQLTLFLGTDYSLNNSAISNSYYSMLKTPYGFPMNPDKWSIVAELGSPFSQLNPTPSTWYNYLSIELPPGCWNTEYQTIGFSQRASAGSCNVITTLSTTNNGETDRRYSSCNEANNITSIGYISNKTTNMNIHLTSKTTYYLNVKTTRDGITLLAVNNSVREIIYIKATIAYL